MCYPPPPHPFLFLLFSHFTLLQRLGCVVPAPKFRTSKMYALPHRLCVYSVLLNIVVAAILQQILQHVDIGFLFLFVPYKCCNVLVCKGGEATQFGLPLTLATRKRRACTPPSCSRAWGKLTWLTTFISPLTLLLRRWGH